MYELSLSTLESDRMVYTFIYKDYLEELMVGMGCDELRMATPLNWKD